MARLGIGIDIGTDSVRLVTGTDKKGVFHLKDLVIVPHPPDASPEQIGALLGNALGKSKVKGEAFCGLTGRDVMIRYSQVPPVPDWQLRQLMEFEIQEMVGQSGEDLAADFNLIPVTSDLSNDDTVLLALAKQGVMDDHLATLNAAGVPARAFTPNSVAIYNAYRRMDPDSGTQLLVNVGAKNTDVAVVRDGDLLFARNLSGGGGLFDDALVASFNVSPKKARQLKEEMANVAPFDGKTKRSAQEEKVTRALAGATGQLLSMVQSSITFARSQTGVNDLQADKVLLCGGGAQLRGLDAYLSSNLRVPVERLDVFSGVETSAVDEILDDDARAVCSAALGLAYAGAYDDVYSLEILPAPLKKARAFKERTVFAVLAAVLVIGFLGFDAYRSKTDFEAATRDIDVMRREQKKRSRMAGDFETAVLERQENAARLELLEEHVVTGVGLSRTLALLQQHLPPSLYVRSIETPKIKDEELGIVGSDNKPVIVVRGEGREGAQGLGTQFNRFVQLVRDDPAVGHNPKSTTSPASGDKPYEWQLTLNFAVPPPPPEGDEDADEAFDSEDG